MKRKFLHILAIAALCAGAASCTDLSEELYSSVTTENYYNTKASRFDHNFLHLLRTSLQEGRTRYTDAFRLTGCWGDKYDKLMARVTE